MPASLGIKKVIKNKGQYNAFVSNQQNFPGLFCTAIVDLSEDHIFKKHDLYQKTNCTQAGMYMCHSVLQ